MNRRDFMGGAAALGITSALAGCTPKKEAGENTETLSKHIRHNPIGVSTYSFWQFNGPKENMPIETCIDKAAAMGFDGIEFLLVQMASS